MYALSTRPLIQTLTNETANDEVKQVWYADDSSAVGSLVGVRKWWEYLKAKGLDFGYYPKPAKTILMIKDSSIMQYRQKFFKNQGIKITDHSERFLGSVVGTKSFKEQYTRNKVEGWVKHVEGWVKQLELLSKYTQDDPQAAYSAFTKGLCSRCTHFQTTVPDMSELFEPLENVIRDQLILALVGREVSEAKRQILALPLRHGGVGLTDPQETAETKYKHSTQITDKLTTKIYTQKLDLDYNPSDQLYTTHEKQNTTREEHKMPKQP